jgi:hypothetical protein
VNKLVLALVIAAVVVVPQAEAFYRGLLEQQADWRVTVEGGAVAVTVTWVKGKALKVAGAATATVSQPASLSGTFPKSVTRMIVEVDVPINGGASVTIEQGVKRIEDGTLVNGDTRFVFDVVP